MSSAELRVILDDLVLQYASRVEMAADRIIAQTRDTTAHKNALLWKSNGIAACFQAATRRDPLAAFLNIWILNKQSLDLFRQPDSPTLFGDAQSIAVETTLQLEPSFEQVLEKIGREFPIGEDFATRFAADHPIHNLYFDRASIAEHYTDYVERITISNRDLKEVVGDLDGQIDQFHKLSAMYAEFLPKQARWQAELLVLETIQGDAMQIVLGDLTSATQSIDRVANVVESVPDLVARERDILRQTISEERIATMEDLDRMQSSTMQGLQSMQTDTLQEIRQERIAVMQEIKGEREAILGALQEERISATEDLAEFGGRIVDRLDSSADLKIDELAKQGLRMTDHFFKRAAQLTLLLLAVLAVIWWLHRRQGSPSRLQDSDGAEDGHVQAFPEAERGYRRSGRPPNRRAA